MTSTKINLLGQSYEELQEEIKNLGEPNFRVKQLWMAIYVEGVKNFDEITTLSNKFKQKLHEKYNINRPTIVTDQISNDGTRKFLLKFEDNVEIETVLIPRFETGTLCISSQVGCNMGCKFCHTGTQKLVRNLKSYEIVAQVMLAKDIYNDYKILSEEKRAINNIVFMGMGEPLHNYKEVKKAIKIFNHQDGLAFSRKKITISTCGIIPNIEKMCEEIPVNLALSLHAPTNNLRDEIMPINKVYKIEDLIKSAKKYYDKTNTKKITLAYVMMKGINDTKEHAKELSKLAKKIPSKFNLIPFHPWKGCLYEKPSNNTIKQFAGYLNEYGFTAPIRKTRGDDISAACGQLKSHSIRIKNKSKNT